MVKVFSLSALAAGMLFGIAGAALAQQQQGGQMPSMQGMDHSNMPGMDHSRMQGMNMQGMDHSNMPGMQSSGRPSTAPAPTARRSNTGQQRSN